MCQFAERRIDTATTVTRAGLEALLFQARSDLDWADRQHLLHRLCEPDNGHKALLRLLAELIAATRDTVREWNTNHEAATATLDQAATRVADLTELIATARILLTPAARLDVLTPPADR
ncbi:hypothetical protein ACFYUJ_35385 [Streptomyces sp. NPDC004520]|uniref:hypothetical protein n=1 Tax=Streptomyces sp. NPDC004520 TaxID=3364702 RepID=UPI0036A163E6